MSDRSCRFSVYLRIRERGDDIVIFHELHPDPVYCRKAEWAAFSRDVTASPVSALYRTLAERKLIISSPADNAVELRVVTERLMNRLNQPRILYLMLAQGCNFACRYCPIPALAKRHGETLLSTRDAIAGVDLWLTHLREDSSFRDCYVIFYGGEPLLNKEVIVAVLRYLAQVQDSDCLSGRDIHHLICTNGSLFDRDMIRLCKECNVEVVVGIDGPGPLHDRLRVDQEGHGTYEEVARTVRMLVAEGIRTYASVSITPSNIDRLVDCVVFFKELGIEKIGFNLLRGRLLLDCAPEGSIEDYYRRAAQAIVQSARCQREPNFEYQLEKKLSAFNTGDFFPDDCTCYGNQLVIHPDGQVSHCPFHDIRLGHVRHVGPDFRIRNASIVQEWRRRLPICHSGFDGVDWKSLCGAGCAWSCGELYDDIFAVDEGSKILGEEVFNEFIWSRRDSSTF